MRFGKNYWIGSWNLSRDLHFHKIIVRHQLCFKYPDEFLAVICNNLFSNFVPNFPRLTVDTQVVN